jgi:hypothetical protein
MIKISNHKPIDKVNVGDEFIFLYDISCRNGKIVPKGSKCKVIEYTGMTPHNEIMDRGYNLLIETVHGVSVWSTFEQCVSRKLLDKTK